MASFSGGSHSTLVFTYVLMCVVWEPSVPHQDCNGKLSYPILHSFVIKIFALSSHIITPNHVPMYYLYLTLRASMEKHNDAFESLLNLIPSKYYIHLDLML